MRLNFLLAPILGLALSASSQATAGDWQLGLGIADFSRHGAPTTPVATLEWHATPPWRLSGWQIGPAAAFSVDGEGDLWAGAGLAARYDLHRWYVTLEEMPGLYHPGSDRTSLGGPVEFRSLFGVGYRLGDTTSLSLSVDHRSNATLYDENPGVNSVSLRLSHRF